MKHDQLIDACSRNDRKAQMEIYQRYYRAMYNVSLRILGNTQEAEDVMQESFLSAFQKIGTYRGEVTFGAWLKKIVINRSLDVIKTRKSLISLESVPDMPDEGNDDAPMAFGEITPEMISNAIAALPDGYRVVLTLYLLEGFDHDEIAGILQISNATSRTQYHRARKKLVSSLKELKAVS